MSLFLETGIFTPRYLRVMMLNNFLYGYCLFGVIYFVKCPLSLSLSPFLGGGGQNTGVGCHSLLQGIFQTQGWYPGLQHWRQTLYRFPGGSDGKACNVEDPGSIPGLGRSPGEGNGNPLQYSCLENSMDGGAWWATQSRGLQRVRHD